MATAETIGGGLDLTPVGVFVRVVQAGSFNIAAKQLGMPNSTVSAQVSRLERRLGVTLLHRTTRKIQLSEEGRTYFNKVAHGIEILQSAEQATNTDHSTPKGLVRVTTASDILPPPLFASLVAEFQHAYPDIKLELDLTQRIVDLTHEGFDVAIRASALDRNRLMARRIGTIRWVPVASVDYLRRAPTLEEPSNLAKHALIEFYGRGARAWRFQSARKQAVVSLPGNITVNHLGIIRSLLISGQGIALLPAHYIADDLERGTLARVLPGWSSTEDPIYAVYPEQQHVAARTRAFLDFVADFFKRHAR